MVEVGFKLFVDVEFKHVVEVGLKLVVEVGFKLVSEGVNRGAHMYLIRKSIPNNSFYPKL